MFLPQSLRCDEFETLSQVISQVPLGTLITPDADAQPVLDHVPFILEPPGKDAPHGVLHTHVARANTHWSTLPTPCAATIAFHTPGAYISPTYYATYAPGARHVPTFYYVAVHARGKLELYSEPEALEAHLSALSAHFERDAQRPWTLEDAESTYRSGLISAIVGVRIVLTQPLVGKFKLGQNRRPEDRRSVAIELERGSEFERHIARHIT